jgi:hypothetical protein
MVVREVEQGGGLEFTRKKYGIAGSGTIGGWIRKLGKHHLLNKIVTIQTMTEQDRLKLLEKENLRLKVALADAYMAKDCLEGVIRMADEEYQTDLKKSFGTPSPASSKASTAS